MALIQSGYSPANTRHPLNVGSMVVQRPNIDWALGQRLVFVASTVLSRQVVSSDIWSRLYEIRLNLIIILCIRYVKRLHEIMTMNFAPIGFTTLNQR